MRSFPGSPLAWLKDRRGNFALMTAILAPVMLSLAAVAIDTGSLFLEKRRMQAAADIAAVAAAANLGDPVPAVLAALSDNGFAGMHVIHKDDLVAGSLTDSVLLPAVMVATGRYSPLAETGVRDRFVIDTGTANAARVTLYKKGERYFGAAIMPAPLIAVQGLAGGNRQAAFSIGSRLLKLEGGLVNDLLGALTGSSIDLTVMDYEALASADIKLLGFLDALAMETGATVADYDTLLATTVDLGDVLGALSRMSGLPWAVKNALTALKGDMRTGQPGFQLAKLLDVGPLGGNAIGVHASGLAATVSALDLIGAAAAIASAGKQVELDLGASIPGLLSARVHLGIGEPPQGSTWYAIGKEGALVRTAQTRLYLETTIGGPGGLLGNLIRLPLYVEVAYGEAKITGITCQAGKPDSTKVTVAARPGVATISLGEINPATIGGSPVVNNATLISVPLLVSVKAKASADVGQMQPKTLTFNMSDIANGTIRRVSTTQTTASLLSSLLGNVALEINVIGLGIGLPSNITGLLRPLLVAAATPLDRVLSETLALLGITIGEADVRVHAAECGRAVLVQ